MVATVQPASSYGTTLVASIETMAHEDSCVSVRPRSSGKPRGKAPTIGGPWTAVVGGYVHSITGEPYVKGQNKKATDAAYEKRRRQWRSAAHIDELSTMYASLMFGF